MLSIGDKPRTARFRPAEPVLGRYAWLVAAVLGIFTVIAVLFVYRHMNPSFPQAYVEAARNTGQDPAAYTDQMKIMDLAEARRDVDGPTWDRLTGYLGSSNPNELANVIGCLSFLSGPRHVQAANLLRPFVNGDNKFLCGLALIGMRKVRAPDWRSQAERFVNDPDPLLRRTANQLVATPPAGE